MCRDVHPPKPPLSEWAESGFTVSEPPSLQHDVFEVFLQDGVLDGVKDEADVFSVHGGGEVVEQRLPPVPPLAPERLHQEHLEGEREHLGLARLACTGSFLFYEADRISQQNYNSELDVFPSLSTGPGDTDLWWGTSRFMAQQ